MEPRKERDCAAIRWFTFDYPGVYVCTPFFIHDFCLILRTVCGLWSIHCDPGVARQSDSTRERLSQNSGRQKHSRVSIAAAKSTLESAWRPPKLLKSLSGGRRIDSM
ncbi:hypothetical protein PoB_000298700 [Plakobranchus ocellatus]|uniref:Uncharacterized protein n=1 Tax=Plakobranchus ocellatus TaxID=259542 RepID=A0AAV3Y206_9GAST|nr:hypothetical protein PoB_000298700 [Plakobranchus ocellatus]